MPQDERDDEADKNVRIRPVDHAAFEEIQRELRITNKKDLVTAMRLLWQSSSERARTEAIRKVQDVDSVPA